MPSPSLIRRCLQPILRILLLGGTCACAGAAPAPGARHHWPDNFVTRVEALALLQTLNAELLSHDSATLTLQRWCASHRLASPPIVRAERVAGIDKAATDEQRRELGITPSDTVRYRRVRLMCGDVLLSEADNWYVPARLTAQMNRQLDSSDMPFGRVVQALHFQRHTLAATLLWLPLPAGWEMKPAAAAATAGVGADLGANADAGASAAEHDGLIAPPAVLQHRAVLSLPDGTPFSEVVETYTGNVLAFAPPGS